MTMAGHIAGVMDDVHRRALSESGWLGDRFLFAGRTELALAFSRRGLLDEGGFTPLGCAVRDIVGRGKAGLADRRLASVDTHPKDGDAVAAPLVSGAVGEAETPNSLSPQRHPGERP